MRHLRSALLLLILAAAPIAAAEPATSFPLKDGDVWVMAGDSITAQHQHSNYFEAFCYARYPNMKFAFRNSGVGGHTIPSTLDRFAYDIAAWKPTVVSVELGMNDQGGTATEKFIANMGKMTERIRGIQARPVILSASPINNGDTLAKLGGNKRLDEYAAALKTFAAKEELPYADQFHMLVDVWGKNKQKEVWIATLAGLKQKAADDSLAGIEHLREFLAAQEKIKLKATSMQGDAVHPGPTGQLMMAAALLKALGADGFVSSATLDAEGKTTDAKGCKITDVKSEAGKLAFDRLDERLPFPIPEDARPAVAFDPTILEMSRYTLKVNGLKEGDYTLKVNGILIAKLTAEQLKSGVNLTSFGSEVMGKGVNPIAGQGKAILSAVAIKESQVDAFRSASKKAYAADAKPELKEQLAALSEKVEAADAKIRDAAKPAKLHFEIAPVAAQ
jgi:lysophospholipase L1-like esterase